MTIAGVVGLVELVTAIDARRHSAPTATDPRRFRGIAELQSSAMGVVRTLLYGAMGLVMLGGVVSAVLALTSGTDTGQKSATVFVALASLVITILKIVTDVVIAPQDQLRLDRMKRREVRIETAAAEVQGYFGVLGAQLLGQLETAWSARDADATRDRAGYLASMAEHCYHIAEPAADELEILIGVVWVEAGEVRDAYDELSSTSGDQWAGHPAEHHLQLVREYFAKVQERLVKVLALR